MAMKEITDDFNSLFLDARKEYLEALKAESKTQYDKFIKDLGKHCIKLVRKMRGRLGIFCGEWSPFFEMVYSFR